MRHAWSLLVLFAVVIAVLVPSVRAQPIDIDVLDITGRDFAGQRLPLDVATGPLALSATRATTWQEPGLVAPDGRALSSTLRLLLEGDVRVEMGTYTFSANRAVVWMSKARDVAPEASAGAWQVFVYFDQLGTGAADAAIAVSADRLPVQGIIAPTGSVELRADVTVEGRAESPLVFAGERVLANYLRRLVGGDEVELVPAGEPVYRAGEAEATPEELERWLERLPATDRVEPIFAGTGIVALSVGEVTLSTGPDENAAIVSGGVVVEYADPDSRRVLQLTADRGVVFLEPGPLTALARLKPESVRGIYLEGGVVATDGQYTLRGPRVYYDLQRDQAVVLDAVFWTYDRRLRMPLYLRADAIRQTSADQFTANRAVLSTTGFATPHLSVGMSEVTLTRMEPTGPDGDVTQRVDAKNITTRASGVPFFYFPRWKGDPNNVPLEGVGLELSSNTSGVRTVWDVATLVGVDKPKGFDADLLLDGYFDRGLGIGTEIDWDRGEIQGEFFAYGLPDDTGTDRSRAGDETEIDGETRGLILAENRWSMNDQWTLFGEAWYASDPAFVDSFFRNLGKERREFTNALTLRYREDNTAFFAQGKANVDDFTPNEYLLQSQGYTVDKLPELEYFRVADDLLEGWQAGVLTYTSEYRYSRMQMQFVEPTLAEQGFVRRGKARRAFGLNPDDSIADSLRAQGFTEDAVNRFDTRHELNAPLDLGPFRVTPSAVGRVTLYDNEFEDFSPDETDRERFWAAAGVTVATSLVKVNNEVESDAWDLHRIRHIIEPSVSVWHGETTVDRADLPVYDDGVESLLEGTQYRFAIDQTWQTYRGGPGRWRSVDWIELDTEIVLSSESDEDRESPIGRYVEYRPEYSNAGDYFTLDAIWQVSDAFTIGGQTIYDFDASQQARTSAGMVLQHSREFSTFAEVRFINPEDSTYIDMGVRQRITPKYQTAVSGSYDVNEDDFARINFELRRSFPNAELGFGVSHNRISDQTSFNFILSPVGLGQSLRFRDVSNGGPLGG